MKRSVCVVISLFALSSGACHSNSTTATTPTPTPTTVSLTGTVTAVDAGAIAGALVKILDGPNVGMSTTTSSAGIYSLTGLTAGNANLSASASTTIYDEVRLGVLIDGTNTLNFVFAVPACKTNNTAMVTFGNRSATATQDIIWDGTQLFCTRTGADEPADHECCGRGAYPAVQDRRHCDARLRGFNADPGPVLEEPLNHLLCPIRGHGFTLKKFGRCPRAARSGRSADPCYCQPARNDWELARDRLRLVRP